MEKTHVPISALAILAMNRGCLAPPDVPSGDAMNEAEAVASLKCSQGDPDCHEPEPGGGNSPIDPPGSYRPDTMVQMSVFGCELPLVVQVMAMAKKQVPGGRATCINGELRVGAWRTPKGTDAQRDAAMNGLSPRGDDETFGLFVNHEAVHRQISSIWSSMPKRWSIEDEIPDPDGSIYLSYWNWDLRSVAGPNGPYGKLRIAGTYSAPILGPVSWTADFYDTPSIDASEHLACKTSDAYVDIDSWLPLELFVGDDDVSFVDRGPLCQAIDLIGTATSQLLIPGGNKIDFAYTRVSRSGSDLTAGGIWSQVSRSPSIGELDAKPALIKLAPETLNFTVAVAAKLHDLRPPLTIAWQRRQLVKGVWSSWVNEPGATQTSKLGKPGASIKTSVTWPNPNPVKMPSSVQVRVGITDADGLTASRARSIPIQKTTSTGLPPICDVKPSLPQCNP